MKRKFYYIANSFDRGILILGHHFQKSFFDVVPRSAGCKDDTVFTLIQTDSEWKPNHMHFSIVVKNMWTSPSSPLLNRDYGSVAYKHTVVPQISRTVEKIARFSFCKLKVYTRWITPLLPSPQTRTSTILFCLSERHYFRFLRSLESYRICLFVTGLLNMISSRLIYVLRDKISFLVKAERYPILCSSHIFFIRSSADGHLSCFLLLVIVNDAAINTGAHTCLLTPFSILVDIYLEEGTRDPQVVLLPVFWGTSTLFSIGAMPVYSLTNSVRGSSFSTSSPHLFSHFPITATLTGAEGYLAVVLMCLFPTISFSRVSSHMLGGHLFIFFGEMFTQVLCLVFVAEPYEFLIYSELLTSCHVLVFKYFLPFMPFHSIYRLPMLRVRFKFDRVPSVYFCLCCLCFLVSYLRNHGRIQGHEDFPLF